MAVINGHEIYFGIIGETGKGQTASAAIATLSANVAATGTVNTAEKYEPPLQFTCDPEYLFSTQVTANLGGTQLQKTNDLPAIGVIAHFIGYCNPIFISDNPEAVWFTGNDVTPSTSVVYDGIEWYYSRQESGVSGYQDDSLGNIPTYPTECGWDDSNRTISQQSVLAILAYVNARKVEGE